MLKQINLSTQEMIKAKELAAVLDGVLQEVQSLPFSNSRTRKVEVEWEKDLEIEAWEMLSITLWAEGSPEDARSLWRELDQAINVLRRKLSPPDLDKLDRYASAGLDIE